MTLPKFKIYKYFTKKTYQSNLILNITFFKYIFYKLIFIFLFILIFTYKLVLNNIFIKIKNFNYPFS